MEDILNNLDNEKKASLLRLIEIKSSISPDVAESIFLEGLKVGVQTMLDAATGKKN